MAINLDHVTQQLTVTDTAANADLTFVPKGTGAVKATNATNMIVQSIGSSGFGSFLAQGSTGNNAYYFGYSGSSEVGRITMGASNAVDFATSSAATLQLRVNHTASAVNYVNITGAGTGGAPSVLALGSDTNIPFSVASKGTGILYLSGGQTRIASNGSNTLYLTGNAGSVNYTQITGGQTGIPPAFIARGSDANVGLSFGTFNDANIDFYASGDPNAGTGRLQLRVAPTASAVNYIQVSGSVTGSAPYLLANGSDADVPLVVTSKGAGTILFKTAGGAPTQLAVTHTASAVNYVQLTGNATTGAPTLSTQGSDANISLQYVAKGIGVHAFQTGASFNQFRITATNSSVNYIQVTGAATGVPVQLSAQGSDTNIPLVLQPKGTGALQAQQTDSTATGGNARGSRAVDLQMGRDSASQVADGAGSVIGGGYANRSGGNFNVVAGGNNNNATYSFGVIGGGVGNSLTANSAVIAGGASNVITFGPGNNWSFIGAGQVNTAHGVYNLTVGGYGNAGTSGFSVTTQSATMNGTTAVTLSGSNASIKVGQYIIGTSIAADTYVAAISGTSLTLSKVASGSSTSTLSFYTPHGVVVGGGNNISSGSYSFVGGGGDAGNTANRNVANGDWSFIGGGAQNNASGANSSVLGGANCSATSAFAVCLGGAGNSSSGFGSTNLGGNGNVANGTYAVASGFSSTNRSLSTFAYAAGSASRNGDAQTEIFVLRNSTTDATATVLTLGAGAPSTTNQVILPNNSAYFFTGEVVAGVTGGGNTKGWTIEGVIKRGANAAATTLVGTTVTSMYADVGAATWTIALSADTTNGGLAVTFTGQLATTIRCVAQIRTTEMTF